MPICRNSQNGSHSTVKALEKKNLVNVFDMTVERDPYWNRVFEKTEKMVPTPEQEYAIDEITNSSNRVTEEYIFCTV